MSLTGIPHNGFYNYVVHVREISRGFRLRLLAINVQASFRRARDLYLGLMAVVHHVFQGRRALMRMEHKGGLVHARTPCSALNLRSLASVILVFVKI